MSKKVTRILVIFSMFLTFTAFCLAEIMETSAEVEETSELKITGFQINTELQCGDKTDVAVRTIYEREDKINGKEIKESGLIYGLITDGFSEDDMYLGSENKYVVNYASTEKGLSDKMLGDSTSVDYYIMTMPVEGGYEAEYAVKPYAVLEDGNVVYGECETYNVTTLAKILYRESKMPTKEAHQQLYDKILKDAGEEITWYAYNASAASYDYGYYDSFESVLEDAVSGTMEHSRDDYKYAKAALCLDNEKTMIILYEDVENSEQISLAESVEIDLNEHKISFVEGKGIDFIKDISIQNGTMSFCNVDIALKGVNEDKNARLTLFNVSIEHKNSDEKKGARSIAVNELECRNSKIVTEAYLAVSSIYIAEGSGKSNIENTELISTSQNANAYAVYSYNTADINVSGGSYEIVGKNVSMGIYLCGGECHTNISDVDILAKGTESNNVAIYNGANCNINITGGNYKAVPVPISDISFDSYGVAVINSGAMYISGNVVVSGGNSGVQCNPGSVTEINGGVFKSPNHGGIYVSCGSDGKCVINGGTFVCNREEYTEEYLQNIQPFGAAYLGCSEESDNWSVDIKNATFENQYGNGIIQKSNDNYIPPTINLYNTTVSSTGYSLVIQNNDCVDTYEAYINIYEGTVLNSQYIDMHNSEGNKNHIFDYR